MDIATAPSSREPVNQRPSPPGRILPPIPTGGSPPPHILPDGEALKAPASARFTRRHGVILSERQARRSQARRARKGGRRA